MSTIQRITGMNSGLDVDSLVKTSMKAYQTKIDKETQNKKVLEYQQEQYRQIMSDASDFNNKYLDILKSGNLMSSSTYQTGNFKADDETKVSAKGFAGSDIGSYKVTTTQIAAKASTVLKETDLDNHSGKAIIGVSMEGKNVFVDIALDDDNQIDMTKTVSSLNSALSKAGINANAKYSEFSKGIVIESGEYGDDVSFRAAVKLGDSVKDADKDEMANLTNEFNAKWAQSQNTHSGQNAKGVITKGGDVYAFNQASNIVNVDNIQFTLKAVSTKSNSGTTSFDDLDDVKQLTRLEKINSIQDLEDVSTNGGKTEIVDGGSRIITTAADGTKTMRLTVDGKQVIITTKGTTTTTTQDGIKTTVVMSSDGKTEKGRTVTLADGTKTTTTANGITVIKNGITTTTSADGKTETKTETTVDGKIITTKSGTKVTKVEITSSGTKVTAMDGTKTTIIAPEGTKTTTDGQELTTVTAADGSTITTTKADTPSSTMITKVQSDGSIIKTVDDKVVSTLSPTTLTGETNVKDLKEKIVNFVNDYNKLLQSMNTKLYEKRDKDYMPLTDEQKKEMSESQVTAWEKKAQTGLLRRDNDIERITSQMKSAISTVISGSGLCLEEIGISPVDNYSEKNGILEINEDKLTAALEQNAGNVKDLFTRSASSTDDKEKGGIITKLKSIFSSEFTSSSSSLSKKAGLVGASTQTNNTLTENIDKKKKLIDKLNKDYTTKENALYKKYSALETAMEKLNAQKSSLASMLGQS